MHYGIIFLVLAGFFIEDSNTAIAPIVHIKDMADQYFSKKSITVNQRNIFCRVMLALSPRVQERIRHEIVTFFESQMLIHKSEQEAKEQVFNKYFKGIPGDGNGKPFFAIFENEKDAYKKILQNFYLGGLSDDDRNAFEKAMDDLPAADQPKVCSDMQTVYAAEMARWEDSAKTKVYNTLFESTGVRFKWEPTPNEGTHAGSHPLVSQRKQV